MLLLPGGVPCPHPESSLVGSFVPNQDTGEHVLWVRCRTCGVAWDEETVPLDVLSTVIKMLESGRTTRVADLGGEYR
jgi:hypothetical protein